MTRVILYSSALVAFLAGLCLSLSFSIPIKFLSHTNLPPATALTFTSIFLPYWLVIDTPIPPSDHLTITYGLHRACSSLTSSCRPFPTTTDCLSSSDAHSSFCTLWRSAGFLLSLAGVLEVVTIVVFVIVLAGGVRKREEGWKALVGLMALVAGLQVAVVSIVAYELDYDERFFPGWELGRSWVLCTVSLAVVLGTAVGAGVGSYLMRPEGGYELIPSEREDH